MCKKPAILPFYYGGSAWCLALICALGLPTLLVSQPISYTVSWLGVPVVDVTIELVEADGYSQADYRAQTRSWFETFYAVKNLYQIWVDPESGLPIRYEKRILEDGNADSLWASYEQNPRRVVYSNGLERPWQRDGHSLFSALLWVQQHDWSVGEEHNLLVEVEGVVWEVSTVCTEAAEGGEDDGRVVEMQARFERQMYGEPILSTTDILTRMLPGEDKQLQFSLNLERNEVKWVIFRSGLVKVRADLNSTQ